jgi:hypothetical protein
VGKSDGNSPVKKCIRVCRRFGGILETPICPIVKVLETYHKQTYLATHTCFLTRSFQMEAAVIEQMFNHDYRRHLGILRKEEASRVEVRTR